jgi:hypothetical protein
MLMKFTPADEAVVVVDESYGVNVGDVRRYCLTQDGVTLVGGDAVTTGFFAGYKVPV